MTDFFCGYPGDRDEALVAYLYDDGAEALERQQFEAHLAVCARCRDELDALRGVRTQLARWAPPEPAFAVGNLKSDISTQQWWREIPAWAQVGNAIALASSFRDTLTGCEDPRRLRLSRRFIPREPDRTIG